MRRQRPAMLQWQLRRRPRVPKRIVRRLRRQQPAVLRRRNLRRMAVLLQQQLPLRRRRIPLLRRIRMSSAVDLPWRRV